MTTINFETEECPECGIVFQVTEEFSDQRQTDGRTFYCPNGHGQHYADTPEDQIDKLEDEKKRLQIEVRQLKCKLMGQVGMWDKIKKWWKGGLA